MRIAILNWRDSTHPDGGGAEAFVEEVAKELSQRGHTVTIATARPPGAARESFLGTVRVVRRGGRLSVYPLALAWLLWNRRQIDVVLDGINGVPFWTPLVRRRGIVALVHHVHERQWQLIYPGLWGQLGWWVESRLCPLVYRSTPHLTVSTATRDDLVRIGLRTEQITITRNGISSTIVEANKSRTPRLCVVGRLVPHKQVEHALHVLHQLLPQFPDLQLDIVGDGWWRNRLIDETRRLDLEANVTFHGWLAPDARDGLVAQAWLELMPSAIEGWGLVVLEAATQGTPTLGYRNSGGVAESIMDGETGLLADDLPGLVEKTRRVLSDSRMRYMLSRSARAHAKSFTWAKTADDVEQLLSKVSGHRK